MIITRLAGGLGNQMFQYAIARNLAEKNNTLVKLDGTLLGQSSDPNRVARDYGLGIFNFRQQFASASEVTELLGSRSLFRIGVAKLSRTILGKATGPVIAERSAAFDPTVLRARGDVYLSGYWQSEKYFAEIALAIRKDFTIVTQLSDEGHDLAHRIKSDPLALAVHVRRGDYESNAQTRSVHGLLPVDYYQTALATIAEKLGEPHCYIFSDDPAWVRANLRLPYPVQVVDLRSRTAAEDFQLMMLCRHFVIANSSFSWWSAWLSNAAHKIVIAPRQWFAGALLNSGDMVPPGWICL